MNILVAGIGHFTLTDLGLGPHVIKTLGKMALPGNVDLEDLSTSAVAALHKLAEKPYDKLVLVSAVQRGGAPGTIYREEPEIKLPDESEIQERMAESITGAISIDDTLIICKYYRALPKYVVLIGVEPESTAPGLTLSKTLDEVSDKVIELVLKEMKAGER